MLLDDGAFFCATLPKVPSSTSSLMSRFACQTVYYRFKSPVISPVIDVFNPVSLGDNLQDVGRTGSWGSERTKGCCNQHF